MTFSTVFINTPPPYLSLASDEVLPVVMTIAGSDSSGGAGVEADIKTISAHRCYAMSCITALTIQTPANVYGVHTTPKDVVSQILDVNLNDMKCNVIKTGMLTEDAIQALSKKLKELGANRPKLVVDPVLVATSGAPLADEKLVKLMKEELTHLADLLTPNIPECYKLIGHKVELKSLQDILDLAKEVSESTNCPNILVKGGHAPWNNESSSFITDVLYLANEQKFIVYKGHYIKTNNTHGTGCTLASAIASNLARDYSLPQSIYGAVEYVQNAVTIGCTVTKKHVTSNGPINHLYAVEIPLEKMVCDECFDAHEVVNHIPNEPSPVANDFFTYLITHPAVAPHWNSYVNHDFVKQVAQGTIAPKKFQFFIEQDYSYLVDYGKVYCIAASKAPNLDEVEKALAIVGNIRREMGEHENRLKEVFGVKDNSYFENIQKGPALKNYSRYFSDVAKRGNWQDLVTSLSPCLMGYGQALINHKDYVVKNEGNVYYEWCQVYSSTWYHEGMEKGKQLLNQIASTYPKENIEVLVNIYAQVCELETKFWDAALEFEG
ncbi:hypothetical protein Kpol_1045p51 [Vanderwaltozyma polyspora DSM 70294]|uniref:Pyridoxamine kinase/Phosphomethylpyrimidine kinase domain-containing protein n=1 Tax=Vanderwaltozyma polyspora (strain ATCC 22028 / DSM 70294 / BCRC 21397 / CBS 2163 / NBRC 10782 / NRRL Y-8283 / UCD 57-17) TaxID=436907 RepID=A7TI57_VANPO|nr:uncharacterized protein Kpol_1045p51 [Vanderwaltozyma polyspora DSM 70294]EDO18064.1 hypothetical protein Kpol_1045p51 [Vanderwaltozyma polyspora DSM 70294]